MFVVRTKFLMPRKKCRSQLFRCQARELKRMGEMLWMAGLNFERESLLFYLFISHSLSHSHSLTLSLILTLSFSLSHSHSLILTLSLSSLTSLSASLSISKEFESTEASFFSSKTMKQGRKKPNLAEIEFREKKVPVWEVARVQSCEKFFFKGQKVLYGSGGGFVG